MGKLITYKMELNMEEGDMKNGKEVALQSVERKKLYMNLVNCLLKMILAYLSSDSKGSLRIKERR